MKSFEGYLKQTAGDTYLLLAGGGIKPLSDFWTTTNPLGNSSGNYVLKTGDIMTGPLVVTYPVNTYGSSCPLQIIATGSGSYQRALAISDTDMTAGSGVNIILGKSDTSYNCAHITYHHVADGSTSNYGSLDIHGTGEILNWFGNGNVGIGTTSPTAKLLINGDVVVSNNTLWVQSSTSYSGSSNRMSLSAGHPVGLEFSDNNSINKAGVRIWANGIGIKDSYYAGRNANDSCWIRHVEESNNSGYMEIGTGDDGTEVIYFRHYNTSSTVSYESYIYAGTMYARGFSSTSDVSLKYNIKPISNILPIYLFNWKQDGKKSYGFIALYLQLDMPEIVGGIKEKTVNYAEALSYYLAKLSNIVEDNNINLNNRINMLEKRIHNLETPPS